VQVAEYGVPTRTGPPVGVQLNVNRETIVNGKVVDAGCCGLALSLSVTVTLNVPAAVGVPLNTPAELRVSPAGIPRVAAKVYGGIPPVPLIVVAGYGAFTTPLGSVMGAKLRTGTVINE
jgi:hypothetical protein